MPPEPAHALIARLASRQVSSLELCDQAIARIEALDGPINAVVVRDFERLGESFELAGGNIKNAVVRAAYRAAERRDRITWDDIEFAAEKECINAGKLFRSSRLRDWT